ncbi:MAG TPA: hypothetical protein VJQ08_12715 [Candidatus Dormibacteraeota bacterium]|nr:hypothetical protein [Candidatus Dormibacteraeota bacterium]
MAATQPVWSRVDEAQHTDFIIQLSHGTYPLADRTTIDPETLDVMKSTGVYRFESPGTYPTPDAADIGPPPAAMSARANAVWMSRHLWQLSYESAQTPGYYVLMVPIWWVADRLGGAMTAIFVLRLINALLIALLAPMAVLVAWRMAPGRPEVIGLAGVFGVLLPGLTLNMTRVGNDALAAVIGGAAVLLSIVWAGTRWNARRAVLLGVLLGAGVLVKLTLLGLAPAIAVAMLWPAMRPPLPRRILLLALTGAVVLLFVGVWFAINLHLYGVPVPSARTNRLSIVPPQSFDLRYVPFTIAFFAVSYWSGEPIGALPFAAAFVVLGSLIVLIAAIGLFRARSLGGPVVVALTCAAGMAAVALLLPATAAFQFAGPGRYEYPALPAVAALTGLGLGAALAMTFTRRALAAMYGVGAGALLVGAALGVGGESIPTSAPPPSAATTVASSGTVGQFTITIDEVGHRSGTWIHVTATNAGADEAEWNPAPVVDGTSADYGRSTHLPGDIDPGAAASGWIFIPIETQPGQSVTVRFRDVAVDNYQTVADVVLQLSV